MTDLIIEYFQLPNNFIIYAISQVDCIVTTAGGVEEDLIKCLAPTYIGNFELSGKSLRDQGINRIGNLLVPNQNYCLFENWLMPILDAMLFEQKEKVILLLTSIKISRKNGLFILFITENFVDSFKSYNKTGSRN